jgi:hypothetical protein
MTVQVISKVGAPVTGMTAWAASLTGANAAAYQALAAEHTNKISNIPGYVAPRTTEFDAMVEQYLADCNLEIIITEDTE